jgi:Zn-dependent M28 family amino/carboxypeptidase
MVTTKRGARIHLRNFLARFKPQAPERLLYLAHWDTRPHADQSRNLADQRRPVPGANDGASGVALLLGIADALKVNPPKLGVDLLFDDGEDYGDFADTTETLMGAQYFVRHLPSGYPPLYAVLWDMVGDKDLRLPYEGNSKAFAPEVVDLVWHVADSLGYGQIFVRQPTRGLTDDHVPLQKAGIHAIDVVDFDYGPNNVYHHTTEDTIDKVSAQSLQVVGDVALALLR